MHLKSFAFFGFAILALAATPSLADSPAPADAGGLKIVRETPPNIGIRGIEKDDNGPPTSSNATTSANRTTTGTNSQQTTAPATSAASERN